MIQNLAWAYKYNKRSYINNNNKLHELKNKHRYNKYLYV